MKMVVESRVWTRANVCLKTVVFFWKNKTHIKVVKIFLLIKKRGNIFLFRSRLLHCGEVICISGLNFGKIISLATIASIFKLHYIQATSEF